MTKDEMKNKISMALKDPILQQGFEIICKNLADLEGCLLAEQEYTLMLEKQIKELKILISSLVYEINQKWDINEMNDDLREHAEKIEREVTLSKMADDNRKVLSALGFALVPPKPKADVKV